MTTTTIRRPAPADAAARPGRECSAADACPAEPGSNGRARRRPPTQVLRRRRLAVLVLLVAVVAVVAVALLAGRADAEGPSAGEPVPMSTASRTYVVQPGDSLWSIAQHLAPGRDPRAVVASLSKANGGSALRAGQLLIVPASVR